MLPLFVDRSLRIWSIVGCMSGWLVLTVATLVATMDPAYAIVKHCYSTGDIHNCNFCGKWTDTDADLIGDTCWLGVFPLGMPGLCHTTPLEDCGLCTGACDPGLNPTIGTTCNCL